MDKSILRHRREGRSRDAPCALAYCKHYCSSSLWCMHSLRGFPDSSVGKESACNAGDLGPILRSGRSAGEGIGYPLQYSWASLVAQLVKNLPAMRETWVWSLGWEDPLEKGTATTFNKVYFHSFFVCFLCQNYRLVVSIYCGRSKNNVLSYLIH